MSSTPAATCSSGSRLEARSTLPGALPWHPATSGSSVATCWSATSATAGSMPSSSRKVARTNSRPPASSRTSGQTAQDLGPVGPGVRQWCRCRTDQHLVLHGGHQPRGGRSLRDPHDLLSVSTIRDCPAVVVPSGGGRELARSAGACSTGRASADRDLFEPSIHETERSVGTTEPPCYDREEAKAKRKTQTHRHHVGEDPREPDRSDRHRDLHPGLYRAGRLAGVGHQGASRILPGRAEHPCLGRHDLDRGHRDQHRDVSRAFPAWPTRAISRICSCRWDT